MNTDHSGTDRVDQLEARVKALEDILSKALELAKNHPLLKGMLGMLGK